MSSKTTVIRSVALACGNVPTKSAANRIGGFHRRMPAVPYSVPVIILAAYAKARMAERCEDSKRIWCSGAEGPEWN